MPQISANPADLRAFASESLPTQHRLRAQAHTQSLAAGAARARCVYGNSITIDGAPVRALLYQVELLNGFVFDVSERFRLADLGRLLDGWAASAALAILSARVPIPSRNPGIRMLRLDPTGDGRLVEVQGDLLTARHVVILIPGMTNELSNIDRDLRPRSDAIFDEMVVCGGPDVAVITWLGYDTPDLDAQGLIDGATTGRAERGAAQLISDVNALRSAGLNSHVTVVAHSYGTIVAGLAMRTGLAVNDLVVVGSPGMAAKNRKALGSPNVKVWATATNGPPITSSPVAEKVIDAVSHHILPGLGPIIVRPIKEQMTGGDPITKAPVHGPDPTDPGFGADVFASSGRGHSAYFDRGSTGLSNIGRIAVGIQPR
jgi:Alpha/beta hydrolase